MEMLLNMLGPEHRSRSVIEKRLYSLRAGMAGERKVLQYLFNLNLPVEILWDVNLRLAPGHYAQLDVLVLTPFHAIIYEAKNMADRLRFETDPSRLDKWDAEGRLVASYECPMLQLQEEMANLRQWFYDHHIACAVDGAVVMTGSAMIEKPPRSGKIFRVRQIREHISSDFHASGGRTLKEIRELANYIRSRNEPYISFPLIDKVGIDATELLWNPVCENCGRKLERVTKRRWSCRCNWETADPYTRTLEKWFLLRSSSISNADVRKLFDIPRTAAANLLGKYPLMKIGQGKATTYLWDYNGRLTRSKT
ncbi:nuclease-related domain-containing protein [Bhargavaea cecembensis]|nr:nuclease-related domain-containing protein [Bhargavaea cecembensis]